MGNIKLNEVVKQLISKTEYLNDKVNTNTSLIKGKIDNSTASATLSQYQNALNPVQTAAIGAGTLPFTQALKDKLENNDRSNIYLGEVTVSSIDTEGNIQAKIGTYLSSSQQVAKDGDYVEVIKLSGSDATPDNAIGYITYTKNGDKWVKGPERDFHVHEASVDAFIKIEADAIFGKKNADTMQDDILRLFTIEQYYTINQMLYGGQGLSGKVYSEIQGKGQGKYLISRANTANMFNREDNSFAKVAIGIGPDLFTDAGENVAIFKTDANTGVKSWVTMPNWKFKYIQGTIYAMLDGTHWIQPGVPWGTIAAGTGTVTRKRMSQPMKRGELDIHGNQINTGGTGTGTGTGTDGTGGINIGGTGSNQGLNMAPDWEDRLYDYLPSI